MNYINRRLFVAACVAALTAALAFADYTPVKPEIVSSRLNAMGGANPALIERGIDTLSTNPAALAFEERTMRIIGIEAEVSGPFSDAISIINTATSGSSDEITSAVLQAVSNNSGIYFGANLTGPISVACVAKNFGFGVSNRTYASADIASLTSADFSVGEELLATAGFGAKIIDTRYHELALGIQGKLYFQADASLSGTIASLVQTMMDFSIDTLPANSAIGAGFDIGLIYRFAESLSVGVVCKDAFTAVFYGEHESIYGLIDFERISSGSAILDKDLQAGISWQPRLPRGWRTLTSFTLAAGMSDLLNITDVTARNPVLNVTLGTEVVFFDILAIRLGLYETYPAVGLGVNLKNIFQLDLALYGRELGYEPGERPVYNLALGLGFGF